MQTHCLTAALACAAIALALTHNSPAQAPGSSNAAPEAAGEADAVVVSATRIPQAVRDVGVSVTVVPRERIEELNAQNASQVLEEVADARVNSYGSMGAESEVTVRGSSGSQVLVMVDGRPVNVASVGETDLSMYPVEQIERIEIIRGPGSVLYGAGAMAGVVNIITRDPPPEMRTRMSASYGSRNTRVFELDNGARFGSLGYLVTASRNASDGWRDNSFCDGYNMSGKLDYDLAPESRLTFNGGFSRQNKGVPGSESWPSPEARQYDRLYWFDLTHRHEFATNTCLTGKIFLNQNWQNYKDPDMATDNISKNQKTGLDVQQTLPAGESHMFLGGIYAENDYVNIRDKDDASVIGGNRDLFTGAVFLQDEISFLRRFALTPGLRCDMQSKWGAELSPKISGLYKVVEGTSLKASVGRGFRAPTVSELYWREDYSQGNPDLRPEESFSYDAGVRQELGERTALQISLFQSHLKNLISWFDDGSGVYRAENVNSAFLQGLETELSAQITEEISAALNYTLLGAKDTSGEYDGETLTYRPKNKVNCRLGYRNKRGLTLSVNAEYTDSVYANRSNTQELGGFMTMGAYAAQKIGNNLEIFARGDNLLDKQYQLVNGYPMPGASLTGGVKATF